MEVMRGSAYFVLQRAVSDRLAIGSFYRLWLPAFEELVRFHGRFETDLLRDVDSRMCSRRPSEDPVFPGHLLVVRFFTHIVESG